MAPERCQPFDLNRQGLLLGEGAGLLVLESEAHANGAGAHLQAEVGGYGLSCDGYHITRPHPDATGSIAAMRAAIARSGLTPDDVDFVNAHGTGTRHNDAAEAKVVRDVFGDRRVPISSMKSMLGHCMGAASALEAIGCVFTLRDGRLPAHHRLRDARTRSAISTSSPTSRGAARPTSSSTTRSRSAATTPSPCFARPGVLRQPDRRLAS